MAISLEPPEAPEVVPPAMHTTVKGELITSHGFGMSFMVFFVAFLVQLPICLCYVAGKALDPDRQRAIDYIIGFWATASMTLSGYRPRVVGAENLPDGACVFVPNHTSFLDILTLSGFVPHPMKYVSKASILEIPFIGWPMKLAGHIPLKQGSRRSELETFKLSVQALEAGNALVAFPEGGRSDDGRLKPFKRGPFKMAARSGVPIVPVSISDLARWYPRGSLMPIAVPRDVVVTIHPPIHVGSRSEEEMLADAYNAVNSALPPHQQGPPLDAAAA